MNDSKENVTQLITIDSRVEELIGRVHETVRNYSLLTGLNKATVIGVLKYVEHEILHEEWEE